MTELRHTSLRNSPPHRPPPPRPTPAGGRRGTGATTKGEIFTPILRHDPMRRGTGAMQGLGQIMGEIFTPLDFNKGHHPLLTLLSRLYREQHRQFF